MEVRVLGAYNGPMADERAEADCKIWLAIQYLDPDQGDNEGDIVFVVSVVALAVVGFIVWLLLHFRGLLN
jgi:hypothetical protein